MKFVPRRAVLLRNIGYSDMILLSGKFLYGFLLQLQGKLGQEKLKATASVVTEKVGLAT